MNILYTAEATATGTGRGGHVRSADDVLDLDLSIPEQLGGPGAAATNPEQLFAAAYAACFHNALQVVARQQKVSVRDSSVTAGVGIGPEGQGYDLAVTLDVSLPGIDRDLAGQLVTAAHQVCPYPNAGRGDIDVRLRTP